MEKITVNKSYLEALMRRANFCTDDFDRDVLGGELISIARSEYHVLTSAARDLKKLKQALISGGVTQTTLDTLLGGAPGTADDATIDPSDSASLAFRRRAFGSTGHSSNGSSEMILPRSRKHDYAHRTSHSFESTTEDFDELYSEVDTRHDSADHTEPELRTLYFHNLPPQTTHAELLSVIQGGRIISINMRADRGGAHSTSAATVTFLDGAAEFLAHSKRKDIYLGTKRIEVKWADRQFCLNDHVANKIKEGATRNLLIHNAVSKGLTSKQIVDDMEHIHNLVIVHISIRDGNALISTNAVFNALYARTCMMSRKEYKGCKIEFVPDECDVPLPERKPSRVFASPKVERKITPLSNRYDLLELDGDSA